MDTVLPADTIRPIVCDDIIRTDGSSVLGGDDKSGIAAVLEMARVLNENPDLPRPALGVVLSVQEEVGLIGAKALDASIVSGQPCLVLDAGGKPGTLVNGAPFQHSFTARVTGRAAHAGIAPEQGISAIECAAAAIASMQLGRLDAQSSANVGTISGGVAKNIVPAECLLVGECRSHNEQRLGEIKEQISNSILAAAESFQAQAEIDWEENYRGFLMPEDDPLLSFCTDVAKSIGLEARTEVSGGGADTNVYAAAGARALSLGTGMSKIHTTSEELAVADLNDLARYCLALAVGFAAKSGAGC
jgi:tripeptide aminopeptidase